TEGGRTQASRTAPGRVERRSPWVTALPWAIAACLAIAAVSSLLSLRRVINSTNQELAQMRLDLRHVNEQLVASRERNLEFVQVLSALEKPGSAHIYLAAQKDTHQDSRAFIAWDKPGNKWDVMVDMHPAPAGKVYQLWFLTENAAPKSAGLIKTGPTGHSFVEVEIPSDVGKIAAAAI